MLEGVRALGFWEEVCSDREDSFHKNLVLQDAAQGAIKFHVSFGYDTRPSEAKRN